jgi:hypothetical protein
MHQSKHITIIKNDLGDIKTYCTECGRFIEHKPMVAEKSFSDRLREQTDYIERANRTYIKAINEDETAFRIFAFVASSLVILGLMGVLSGCGQSFCPLEYNIDGEWRKCSVVSEGACGTSLNCNGASINCLNGAESRVVSCR